MPAVKDSSTILFGNRDHVIAEIRRGHALRVIAVPVSDHQEESNLRKFLAEAIRRIAHIRAKKIERTRERWIRDIQLCSYRRCLSRCADWHGACHHRSRQIG
jgi:hypothetical protein